MTAPGFAMLALNRKTESSPVGVLPPVQVTCWTTALSPDPVDLVTIFHGAGGGSNESIANDDGTVSTILVVIAPDSSVGTESVNCCRVLSAFTTAGLMIACAEAVAARTSAPARAPTR